jgi:hypothetical protein
MSKKPKSFPIFQVKITLRDSEPAIWRRILIPAEYELEALHHIIQLTFGWENCHLHGFDFPRKRGGGSGLPLDLTGAEILSGAHLPFNLANPVDGEDETQRLDEIFEQGIKKFKYTYDFGDCWEHDIVIEKQLEAEPGVAYPKVIKGASNTPAEDCGGIWGHMEILELIAGLKDGSIKRLAVEDRERLDFVGRNYDPLKFDVEDCQKALKKGFHLTVYIKGEKANPKAPAKKRTAKPKTSPPPSEE